MRVGTTTLMDAARGGHVGCFRLLLQDGRVGVDERDDRGRTALYRWGSPYTGTGGGSFWRGVGGGKCTGVAADGSPVNLLI
jgi:hypothetical protein